MIATKIIGIGVDTTGSTPLPVDADGVPLGLKPEFKDNVNAQAWLWKDHTAHAEAEEITETAATYHPEYLAKCGGVYSSEWFFSKILHCLRTDRGVFDAAHTWVEHADYIPALLTGTTHPSQLKRCRCAAGHKAMFNDAWGGLPCREFLDRLDPKLGALRERLYDTTTTIAESAGTLSAQWAQKLGLTEGIPVAMGAFDAHLGAVGSGIKPGVLSKTIGTSTCDMLVTPNDSALPDIAGVCGIVDGSILPGYFGIEAGQSAVGDIFNWFVNIVGPQKLDHGQLSAQAAKLAPGESGLLALDWNNGNRCLLVDQRLSGLLLGQTLHTTPAEIYRALIEATAFGALAIVRRLEQYGQKIDTVVCCGGISQKNALLMQIYADVLGRSMTISDSDQTCALGAAMAGAVVAGSHADYAAAQEAMTAIKDERYEPDARRHATYGRLFELYMMLHDAFGVKGTRNDISGVMKELLRIKEQARG